MGFEYAWREMRGVTGVHRGKLSGRRRIYSQPSRQPDVQTVLRSLDFSLTLFLILALFKWNFRSHESLPNGFARQNAKSNTYFAILCWNLKCERPIVLCVCSFPIGLIWIGGRYPTMCRAGLHHHPLCAECSANDKWGSRSPPPPPPPSPMNEWQKSQRRPLVHCSPAKRFPLTFFSHFHTNSLTNLNTTQPVCHKKQS